MDDLLLFVIQQCVIFYLCLVIIVDKAIAQTLATTARK